MTTILVIGIVLASITAYISVTGCLKYWLYQYMDVDEMDSDIIAWMWPIALPAWGVYRLSCFIYRKIESLDKSRIERNKAKTLPKMKIAK